MVENNGNKQGTTFVERLDLFENLLISSPDPIKSLKRENQYHDLDLLIQALLIKSLQLGPERISVDQLKPCHLIKIAQKAASSGLTNTIVPYMMQRTLDNLRHQLIQNSMWDHICPLWWEPLPPPTLYEEIWNTLEENFIRKCEKEDVSGKLMEDLDPGWSAIPHFIDNDTIDKVNDELQNTYQKENLTLFEEGTGQQAIISTDRTDEVIYVNGLETDLLENAPITAILVQWLLYKMGIWLKSLFPSKNIAAPQSVMLSKYTANSSGYSRHLDNPGLENDNGRYLTLVIYLNSTNRSVKGGELAIWNVGADFSEKPDKIIDPTGGTAVILDSRKIPHQVMPLKDGPDRWALVLWFNDQISDSQDNFLPEISLTNILLPIKKLSLPKDILLFHKMDEDLPSGQLIPTKYHPGNMRIGIISTVYQSSHLEDWCRYHYSIGVDHIILVFDHLEEERELLLSERLLTLYGRTKLTIWAGNDMKARWDKLYNDKEIDLLIELSNYSGSTYAISARQTLNASVALQIAKTDYFGSNHIDWLIHLDDDEYFHLEGKGRGGESIQNHFVAASNMGARVVRYINHELLIENSDSNVLRYKMNPTLAESILGPIGWMKLSEYLGFDSKHSYFNAYTNGKSAVYVPTGVHAAGMHSWISEGRDKTSIFLAGPSILHKRFIAFQDFKQKYMGIASSPELKGKYLFPISSLEEEVVNIIRSMIVSGIDQEAIDKKLYQFYNSLKHSKKTVQILEMAGLLINQ